MMVALWKNFEIIGYHYLRFIVIMKEVRPLPRSLARQEDVTY